MQDPVPDIGDHHRRQHDGVKEHRAALDVLVDHQRRDQGHDAQDRHLDRDEPQCVEHAGPEVEPGVGAGLRLEYTDAIEQFAVVSWPDPGPVEQRNRRPAGERNVKIQDHRCKGEQPENQHVGQQQRIGHPAAAPEALCKLYRKPQQIHGELWRLVEPVAAAAQQPDSSPQPPEDADQRHDDASQGHVRSFLQGGALVDPRKKSGAARETRTPGSVSAWPTCR